MILLPASVPLSLPDLPTLVQLADAIETAKVAGAFDVLAAALLRRRADLAGHVDALEELPDYTAALRALADAVNGVQRGLAWRVLARAVLALADSGHLNLDAESYATLERRLRPQEYVLRPPPPRPMVELEQKERVEILRWRHAHGYGLRHPEDVDLLNIERLRGALDKLDRHNTRNMNGSNREQPITARRVPAPPAPTPAPPQRKVA